MPRRKQRRPEKHWTIFLEAVDCFLIFGISNKIAISIRIDFFVCHDCPFRLSNVAPRILDSSILPCWDRGINLEMNSYQTSSLSVSGSGVAKPHFDNSNRRISRCARFDAFDRLERFSYSYSLSCSMRLNSRMTTACRLLNFSDGLALRRSSLHRLWTPFAQEMPDQEQPSASIADPTAAPR